MGKPPRLFPRRWARGAAHRHAAYIVDSALKEQGRARPLQPIRPCTARSLSLAS
jgi:hypothetical protein